MKKVAKLIFILAFFTICIVPVACMGFVSSELSENRTLSEWPEWTLEDGSFNTDFFEEVQTYVAEHFAFRGELVEADSFLKYRLLRSPADEQVILGEGDWMYFDATLEDYGGVCLTGEEIDSIAQKLVEVCDYIEAQGKTPLIMLVPNKNSVYPEYMPARFGDKAEETNLTLLQAAMEKKGVPFVDTLAVLKSGKTQDELYLHQDTHWNNTGARLVLNEVYEMLGVAERHSLGDYTVETVHESDLYKILFPTAEHYEEQHVYAQEKEFSYVGRVRSMDDIKIRATCDEGNGKDILVYRDSFGRAMIPYMSETFSNCTFNRSTPYDMSLVEETECDYVLIEIVERNLADLGGIEVP